MTQDSRNSSGEFFDSLTKEVRANPVPAALIGMGVLWLFAGGSKTSLLGGASSIFGGVGRGAKLAGNAAYAGAGRLGSSVVDSVSHAVDAVSDLSSRAGDAIVDSAGAAGDAVSNAGRQAGQMVSSAYQNASDTVGHGLKQMASGGGDRQMHAENHSGSQGGHPQSAFDTVRPWANNLQQTLGDAFDRQPLLLLGLGLAVGAGMAAALPRTELENKLVGEASDAAKEQVHNIVSGKVRDAQDLAHRAFDEVQAQGLTPQAVGDAVRSVADKAIKVADATTSAIGKRIQ